MTITYNFENHVKPPKEAFNGLATDFIGDGVVTPSSDFPLTFPTPATMSFYVGIGTAYIGGQRYRNDAGPINPLASPLITLTCDPSPDNPRIDLVEIGPVAFDPAVSPWSYGTIQIKKGEAGAVPVQPTVDAGFLALYAVAVAKNAASINVGNITDLRALCELDNLQIPALELENMTVDPTLVGGSLTASLLSHLDWLYRAVKALGTLTNAYDIPTAALLKAGGNMAGVLGFYQGADIASGATVDLSTATGNCLKVTGSGGPITSFGIVPGGPIFWLTFTGSPTVTYNGTSMLIPGAVSLTLNPNDILVVKSLGSGNWRVMDYQAYSALSMQSQKIINLANGSNSADAVAYGQLASYLLLSGGTMAGNIAMNNNKVTGAAAASAAGDLVEFSQYNLLNTELNNLLTPGSSSYALDLNSYYQNNTLLLFDCESGWVNNGWDGTVGTVGNDLTNFKVGSQGESIASPNASGGGHLVSAMDMTKFTNGQASTTNDYVILCIYITTANIGYLATGLRMRFLCDTAPTVTNCFTTAGMSNNPLLKAALVNGWNFIKIRKADFVSTGSPSWSTVKGVELAVSGAPSQSASFTVDSIQMVRKDAANAWPNPFQSYNGSAWVNDRSNVTVDFWFIGLESGAIIARELNPAALANDLQGASALWINFNGMRMTAKALTAGYCGGLTWYVDANNYVQGYVSNNLLTLSLTQAGVTTTTTTAFTVSLNDVVYFELNKDNATVVVNVYRGEDRSTLVTLSANLTISTASAGHMAVNVQVGNYFNLVDLQVFKARAIDAEKLQGQKLVLVVSGVQSLVSGAISSPIQLSAYTSNGNSYKVSISGDQSYSFSAGLKSPFYIISPAYPGNYDLFYLQNCSSATLLLSYKVWVWQ